MFSQSQTPIAPAGTWACIGAGISRSHEPSCSQQDWWCLQLRTLRSWQSWPARFECTIYSSCHPYLNIYQTRRNNVSQSIIMPSAKMTLLNEAFFILTDVGLYTGTDRGDYTPLPVTNNLNAQSRSWHFTPRGYSHRICVCAHCIQ